MQFDTILKQKDEIIQQLQSQITPLKNLVEQLLAEVKLLREQNTALLGNH